jgi:uncharacterized membrane protein YphA (DoxX/SURF4 family)
METVVESGRGAPPRGVGARISRYVTLAVRLGLAGVWAWAAIGKLSAPQESAVIAVRAYRIVPEPLVHAVAAGLPFLELAIAALLILGFRTRLAGVLSIALLAVYVAGIASAWARGLRIDCGCFGGGGFDASVSWTDYAKEIARDVGLMAAALWLVLRPHSPLALERG